MSAEVLIDLVRVLEACRNAKSDSAVLRHLAKSVLGVAVGYTRAVVQELGPMLNKYGLTKEEVKAIRAGRKIEAIKLVRQRTKSSLLDAKNCVGAAMAGMGIDGRKAPGSQKGHPPLRFFGDHDSLLN